MKVWADDEVVTNEDLNENFQEVQEKNNPTDAAGHSDTLGEFQAVTDPAPAGVPSLADNLAGEIERLRFQIKALLGKSEWYSAPDNSTAKNTPKDWGTATHRFHYTADPGVPPVNELSLFAKDMGAGVAALAWRDASGAVRIINSALAGGTGLDPVLVGITAQAGFSVTRINGNQLRIQADRVTIKGSAVYGFDRILDMTVAGIGGLDTGSRAANTFYYLSLLYKTTAPEDWGVIMSTGIFPVIPSGWKARPMGGWRLDLGAFLEPGSQKDDVFVYDFPQYAGRLNPGDNVPINVGLVAPVTLKVLNASLLMDPLTDPGGYIRVRMNHVPMPSGGPWTEHVSQFQPTIFGSTFPAGSRYQFPAALLASNEATGPGPFTFYYTLDSNDGGTPRGADLFVSGWSINWRDP